MGDGLSTQPPLGIVSEAAPAQLPCLGDLGGLGPKLLSPRKSCCCQSSYWASKEKLCHGGSMLTSTVRTCQTWGPLAQGCLGPANWAAKVGKPTPLKEPGFQSTGGQSQQEMASHPIVAFLAAIVLTSVQQGLGYPSWVALGGSSRSAGDTAVWASAVRIKCSVDLGAQETRKCCGFSMFKRDNRLQSVDLAI